jgi:hypothetical protein
MAMQGSDKLLEQIGVTVVHGVVLPLFEIIASASLTYELKKFMLVHNLMSSDR